MKKILPFAVILIMLAPLALHAEWSDHGLTLVSAGPSSHEGATKYELKDKNGRAFYVNSSQEPDGAAMKRIIKYNTNIFGWKHVAVRDLSIYMLERGIQVVLVASSVKYKNMDLKPYLPAGFSFIEEKGGLKYRYRIIVGTTSLKLDGTYTGEEPLLDEMLAYIKGIREGRIIVEDEKVVSGSVISIADEKKEGARHVHPIGDLPAYDKGAEKFSGVDGLKIYVSAQGSYLMPIRFLGDILVGGYGFTASVGLRDLGFSVRNRSLFRFDVGLMSGYWHLDSGRQKNRYVTYTIKSAYTIPLALTFRYRIGIIEGFSISPSVNLGYYYNKMDFKRISIIGTMEKVSMREWNPGVTPNLRFDYQFDKPVFIFAGVDLLVIFERRLTITTLLFSAGVGYIF